MCLYEFNEEQYMKEEREIAEERGIRIGQERGEKIGQERGEKIGQERGEKIGQERGEQLAKAIFKLHSVGKSPLEIAEECHLPLEKVEQILE